MGIVPNRWVWNENEPTNARIQLPQKWEKLARKFHLQTTNTFETFQRKLTLMLSDSLKCVCFHRILCTGHIAVWSVAHMLCHTRALIPDSMEEWSTSTMHSFLKVGKNSPQKIYDFPIRNVTGLKQVTVLFQHISFAATQINLKTKFFHFPTYFIS